MNVTGSVHNRHVSKRCGRCGLYKDLAEFAWRRIANGRRDNYCRPCRAAYKQEHYAANRGRYIRNAVRRTRALAEGNVIRLVEFLSCHPCVDCGEADVMVLEFDHLGGKEFAISRALRERSWEAILAEMAKCQVVCANCHRRRTAQRGGFLRAAVAQRQSLALPRR